MKHVLAILALIPGLALAHGEHETISVGDVTVGYTTIQEQDTNEDGTVDTWLFYDEELLTLKGYDQNGDGMADKWEYYEGDAIRSNLYDTDKDGMADTVEVLDEEGDIVDTYRLAKGGRGLFVWGAVFLFLTFSIVFFGKRSL